MSLRKGPESNTMVSRLGAIYDGAPVDAIYDGASVGSLLCAASYVLRLRTMQHLRAASSNSNGEGIVPAGRRFG